MTGVPPPKGDGRVSRARYERERRARAYAEAILETKSRELTDQNRNLFREAASARAAFEAAKGSGQNVPLSPEQRIIVEQTLAALSGKTRVADFTRALLRSLVSLFDANDVFLAQASGNDVRVADAVVEEHVGIHLPVDRDILSQPQKLDNLIGSSGSAALPIGIRKLRSILVVPTSIPGELTGAILLGHQKGDRYSYDDFIFLERVIKLACEAFINIRETRRNFVSPQATERRRVSSDKDNTLGVSLERVQNAVVRLTDMQSQVVEILDGLLGSPLAEADAGIEAALERIAGVIETEHAFVFRCGPGDTNLICSHEWEAAQNVSTKAKTQPISFSEIEEWLTEFKVGNEVQIFDAHLLKKTARTKSILDRLDVRSLIAVPMIQDGDFHGFTGFSTRQITRNFLPGEVYLLRTIIKVIASVLGRRDAEASLVSVAKDAAQSRATLIAAVEALQDGFALFDPEDRLVLCNDRYREIYQRSSPAIIPGASFEQILRYGLARGEYAEAIGREDAWLAERLAVHRRADGAIEQKLSDGRWLRIFEKATPEGGRVGLRVDITELKLAEARARADLSDALEASQDGIAITNAEGDFLYVNDAYCAMFGYDSGSELIGRHWSVLEAPDMVAWMKANAFPVLQREGRWSGEVMGLAKDGSAVDQEVSLTLKKDDGILRIVREVSERRRATAERARLREELQVAQRREVFGQIAMGLAHDFNNLLAAISGSAALIEADVEQGSAAHINGKRILAASDQAAGLVKRLLALGARQSKKLKIDLRQHVLDAVDLIRPTINAPARLKVDLPDVKMEAHADPTDVLQVVLNLTINARDALKSKAGDIKVMLSHATPEDLSGPFVIGDVDSTRHWFCLSVSDTGSGISSEAAKQIFLPYFSTKGAKGTGLGLSIVSSIVIANEAAVALDSQLGEGTQFRILWPAYAEIDTDVMSLPAEMTGRLDGRSILVVDDQESVLEVLTTFLEKAGAEVAPSSEPEEVLEALQEDPDSWDLLITDFDMPGLSGDELAQRARAFAPNLPVILVTALAGVKGRSGKVFDMVVGKPVDSNVLVSAAEAAIMLRRKGAEKCEF